jgi:hypothetical protein
LIDSHHGSPITQLYLAYQGARTKDLSSGGHLFSASEDGTFCITDLKSDEILTKTIEKANQTAEVNILNKRRADHFMNERNSNIRNQRRHSITQGFSSDNFFKYERVDAT